MSSADLFSPLSFTHGPAMKNRLMLAPLTNLQSHTDGTLSDDEIRWLTMRATGGFGVVMTAAANVQKVGLGFPGQLGVWSDDHLPGLTRLASALKAGGAVSNVQLHHGGIRSPAGFVGQPVGASDDADTGARGLTTAEVEQLIEDFILAAVRSEKAGFDGVELHGAHGYILAQFLSKATNRREDKYGGSLENRARPIQEIIAGVHARCRPDFQLGLRLSPERFGVETGEMLDLAAEMLRDDRLDFLDMSLWDAGKEPEDAAYKGKSLAELFIALPRAGVRLGLAGKIYSAPRAKELLDAGADFLLIGRAAIIHHDFPKRAAANPAFQMDALPVSAEHLRREGLGEPFLNYMKSWAGFVAPETEPA